MCRLHYFRWRKHGDPLVVLPPRSVHPPLRERFWAKVQKSDDGCWLWMGALTAKGYGDLQVNHHQVLAHRLAYEIAYGSLPTGLCVCHHCDEPRCVRPDHLFAGTRAQNNHDRSRKGRSAAGVTSAWHRHPDRYPRGEKRPGAKLVPAQVRAIRAAVASGSTQASLSRLYGVDAGTIWGIVHGKTWRHLL